MYNNCIDHGKTRSLRKEGYAMVGIPGIRSRCTTLHRLVYCKHNDCPLESIAGLVVRHTCDNPRCVNPMHLVLGTRGDNNRDRAERDRSAKHVPSRQRLGQADVIFILNNHIARHKEFSASALARRFGVDSKVIHNVLSGVYQCTRL